MTRFPVVYGYNPQMARGLPAESGCGPDNPLEPIVQIQTYALFPAGGDKQEALHGFYRDIRIDARQETAAALVECGEGGAASPATPSTPDRLTPPRPSPYAFRIQWQLPQHRASLSARIGEAGSPGTSMPERNVTSDDIRADAEWDAGLLGCGEILILLRGQMQPLESGQVLKLIARDQAAPVEMPAWCRLTSRTLLRADHPHYWIEQR